MQCVLKYVPGKQTTWMICCVLQILQAPMHAASAVCVVLACHHGCKPSLSGVGGFAADGNEGGRHNLIAATVNGGELWICKVQIGDKRWFKGANKSGRSVFDSFTVA